MEKSSSISPLKIGITGGIGSGKSFVCSLLRTLGYPVYDCDTEAKRLMAESEAIRNALIKLIGKDAYINNDINKEFIASFLFADKANGQKINSIVHPIVRQDFKEWASKQQTEIVFQECAILFESGFDKSVDISVEVFAPEQLRIERAMSRDKSSEEKIKVRMKQQMTDKEKCKLADYVLINDGTTNINEEIERLISEITKKQ